MTWQNPKAANTSHEVYRVILGLQRDDGNRVETAISGYVFRVEGA